MEASKEAKYEEWFHAIDIDGDGYINSEACLEMIYRRIAIQAQELDNSNSADANLNMESFKGMLEEDHNREFFQVIFPEKSDEEIFKAYDIDGDGSITADEFDEVMEESFMEYIIRIKLMEEISEDITLDVFVKKILDNSDLESFFTVFAIDPSTSYVATAMAGIGLNNSLAVDGDTIQGNSAPSNIHENQTSKGVVDSLTVESWFKSIDTDGNGMIDSNEWRAMVKSRIVRICRQMEDAHEGQNKMVTLDDFQTIVAKEENREFFELVFQKSGPEELFKYLDANGDGNISAKEFADKVLAGVQDLNLMIWYKFCPHAHSGGSNKICLAGFKEILQNRDIAEFVRIFSKCDTMSFVQHLPQIPNNGTPTAE